MADPDAQYATAQDLAGKYQISVNTVRRKVQDGAWPCVRIGRLYRFSPEHQVEIERLIAEPEPYAFDPNRIRRALEGLGDDPIV